MKRSESLDIVGMLMSHWQARWSKDEIDAYAHSIEDLDAELCTSALLRAVKTMTYPPRVNELRELTRMERQRLAPPLRPVEPKPQPIPNWVRRWICARFLYAHFGREQDMRAFPEQGYHADQTIEQMPEGAWEEEAAMFSDEELRKAWASTL